MLPNGDYIASAILTLMVGGTEKDYISIIDLLLMVGTNTCASERVAFHRRAQPAVKQNGT